MSVQLLELYTDASFTSIDRAPSIVSQETKRSVTPFRNVRNLDLLAGVIKEASDARGINHLDYGLLLRYLSPKPELLRRDLPTH